MKTKGTICLFSTQFFPHLGGVERYVYNMAKELIKRGYKVYIITSSVDGEKDIDMYEDIHIIRLPSISMMSGRMPVLKNNRKTKQLMDNLCKQEKIDFVVVNTRFYRLSIYGMKFAKKHQIPVITIEHGSAYLTFNNKFLDIAERVYEKFITQIGKKYCKDYYAVSEYSRKWLKEFHIDGKGVLYNSINPDDYHMSELTGELKEKLSPIENGVSIAYTGRLIPEKGVNVLIEAFEELRKKYEHIYLILMGEGPLESDILNAHDDHIIYLGRQSNKDVINILNKVDVFCLPSRSEGFSTSVLEAALAKCCIITTKRGGSVELINDDRYGIIIEDNRLYFVKEALERVINDTNYRKTSANNVYKRVIENFTWKQCVDELENVMSRSSINEQ